MLHASLPKARLQVDTAIHAKAESDLKQREAKR
jgi:hypothetical protein